MTGLRTLFPALVLLLAGCLAGTTTVPRTPSPSASPVQLAPGITWWRTDDTRGPWRMAIVRVDLTQRDVQLRAVHARDSLAGRETTSGLATRLATGPLVPRVAINADFFDLRTGRSENNQVTDGEWWVGRMVTDSPFDTYDNVHSQLAVAHDGRASIGRYILDARAWGRGGVVPVLGVNHAPSGTYEGTVLYTPRFGARTPRDSARRDSAATLRLAELSLRAVGVRVDTMLFVVTAAPSSAGGMGIPADGAVLSAWGDRTPALQQWRANDTVRVWLGTQPMLHDARPPMQLIGGWPRILEAGVNIAADAPSREGTISRNAEARHPRSAVGLSRDGRTMWLFAVDGRSAASVGMSLVELGDAMRALGAWDALNFDGGGSTALVIDGKVVNAPTDATGERAIANALLVLQRR